MKKFKIFILNLSLFFIAVLLLLIFSSIGFITSVFAIIWASASTNYFRDCAIELDIFGNILCQHLFNATFITSKSKYLFGKPGMTISENLGLNQREKTLSTTGNALAWILDTIDKDHCKNSIRTL